MKLIKFFRSEPFSVLLIFIPLTFVASYLNWGQLWVFILAAAGIIPLAHYIGAATEVLAEHTGSRVGALLNATLGNAAELIIAVIAIREGLLELVLASITGSILGNVLLVLGMSMFLGGIRNGVQTFNRRNASRNAILLLLAVIALLIPSILSAYIGERGDVKVEALSMGVAIIMIVLYIMGLFYGFNDHKDKATSKPAADENQNLKNVDESHPMQKDGDVPENHPKWTLRSAIIILVLTTVGVTYLSEQLVGAVEPLVLGLGVSEFFLGVILIPLIGNVAEHLVGVKAAMQNKMELSVEISVSSSLQIALFVAPILVFVSLLMGNPLQLIFNEFELLALIAGVVIAVFVSEDGESNWLEGAELLAIYLILALAFFLLPV
jgi:Ca2+:H+ antiporter